MVRPLPHSADGCLYISSADSISMLYAALSRAYPIQACLWCAAAAGPRVAGITELPATEVKPEENPQAGSYVVSPARPAPCVYQLNVH